MSIKENLIKETYDLDVIEMKNGIVDVNLSVTVIATSTSWITIGTLPVGYRPITTAYKDAPYWDALKNYKHFWFVSA